MMQNFIWNFMYVILRHVLHADFMYVYVVCQQLRMKYVQSSYFALIGTLCRYC